jgi:hypothetical protein
MGTSRVAPVGTKDVQRNVVKHCFIKAEAPNDLFTPRQAARPISLDVIAGGAGGVRVTHSNRPATGAQAPASTWVHENMGWRKLLHWQPRPAEMTFVERGSAAQAAPAATARLVLFRADLRLRRHAQRVGADTGITGAWLRSQARSRLRPRALARRRHRRAHYFTDLSDPSITIARLRSAGHLGDVVAVASNASCVTRTQLTPRVRPDQITRSRSAVGLERDPHREILIERSSSRDPHREILIERSSSRDPHREILIER